MISPVTDSALLQRLEADAPAYHARVLELRDGVEGWLAYTTTSFAHYTQHTVKHSDEIIRQISKILFRGDDPDSPTVALSPVEAYTCCASAYLHDAGMVVSDEEKLRILSSDGWAKWIASDATAAQRHAEIQSLREGDGDDSDVRHFAADRQLRLLISEYVRRSHHERSAHFIQTHQASLGQFAFDDPLLARTISDCCLAHGLHPYELDDRERYPHQRDVQGGRINVRFCGLLLRLGDLLDLSADRACPLLLNAAAPLPAESLAHWGQYRRIVHRETDPDRIELVAECESGPEHRLLQDWCQWIVDEVHTAAQLMLRAPRHGEWRPPEVSLGSADSTIVIRPAPGASYIPVAWQLQVDSEQVVDRLINDLYGYPLAFIRELLQNAFDASRCHMYREMRRAGETPPEYPNQAPDIWLERFPVSIARTQATRFNELSQADEQRDVLTVEDRGIGMTEEVVLKYLLQIGRSYYTTDDFRRSFEFAPTSRFGVGFLSVFAASDEITVDTLAADAEPGSGIRLTLTGPRNYILTERSDRTEPGTSVQVVLRPSVEIEDLQTHVTDMCRMVEFPVIADDAGHAIKVLRETESDVCYEIEDVTEAGAKMGVRAFGVAADGVFGAIYVFYRSNPSGAESWIHGSWSRFTYPTMHPLAQAPPLPEELTCVHGIAFQRHGFPDRSIAARLDIRKSIETLPLARTMPVFMAQQTAPLANAAVQAVLERAIRKHLSDTPLAADSAGWQYKQALMNQAPLRTLWFDEPATIREFESGVANYVSIAEVTTRPVLTVVLRRPVPATEVTWPPDDAPEWPADVTGLIGDDLRNHSDLTRSSLFNDRAPESVSRLDDEFVQVEWVRGAESHRLVEVRGQLADVVEMDDDTVLSMELNKAHDSVYTHVVLNGAHPFVEWLEQVRAACVVGDGGLTNATWQGLQNLLTSPLWHRGYELEELNRYLARWQEAGLPDAVAPPDTALTRDVFR